jgi:acetylornithine/succinyldiaminopimelate/putrescine aminotransferase
MQPGVWPADGADSPVPSLLPTYVPYPFPIVAGEGDVVYDDAGRAFLDFYGGHCVCSTGHSHPSVVAAIAEQAQTLIFYSAAARIPVRERAAAALVDFAPVNIASVFFCNSGAEANENALKVALKLTGRSRFVAFAGGFHGRTLLALSVSDAPKLKQGYETVLAPVEMLPFNDIAALANADFSDVAAVIVEPIQSMAGVRAASKAWLQKLAATCARAGTLLIDDEVQTGFGRLGSPFAAQHYGVFPDLMTCAKGMASGVPMGAVLMSRAVAESLRPGDLGSTFGGGPLACAALSATLDVIHREKLMPRARKMKETIQQGVAGSVVTRVLGEGLLLGLYVGDYAAELKAYLEQRKILVGGSHNPEVLRLLPPLVVKEDSVAALVAAIHSFSSERTH